MRKLPENENYMKIETSISLRRRDEEANDLLIGKSGLL
jgi:hypothetical protein